MKIDVPFYPQKWELSEWQNNGFNSFEDAEYWERSSCGVLCLKMAMDSILMKDQLPPAPSIVDFIKKGVALGAYSDATGWSHIGLVQLARAFGFSAIARKQVGPTEIRKMLTQNSFPIVSVRWAFENHRTRAEKILFWKKFGGHLALVVGFEEDAGSILGFYVHHTSILPEYNWPYKFIPLEQFMRAFTGRCVALEARVEGVPS
jgi:hypothetical protein